MIMLLIPLGGWICQETNAKSRHSGDLHVLLSDR